MTETNWHEDTEEDDLPKYTPREIAGARATLENASPETPLVDIMSALAVGIWEGDFGVPYVFSLPDGSPVAWEIGNAAPHGTYRIEANPARVSALASLAQKVGLDAISFEVIKEAAETVDDEYADRRYQRRLLDRYELLVKWEQVHGRGHPFPTGTVKFRPS